MERKDSKDKSKNIRSLPFEIDLNEAPLSSPRETVFVSFTGNDVVPAPPVAAATSAAVTQGSGGGKDKPVLLDVNALPIEAEEEENSEFVNSRMHSVCDTSSIGNSNNAPVTCSNLLFVGNGNQFDFIKAPGKVASIVQSVPVDIVQHRLNFVRTKKEVDTHPIFIEGHWANDCSENTVSFQNHSDKFLQNLREFIFDNHGVLEDGWHVEFFYCQKRCKTFAVYCSPDGNKFESMFDVACHLGLVSNCHSMVPQDRNDEFALAQNRLQLHRIRKDSLMFSRTKDFKNCQENLKSNFASEFLLGVENMDADTLSDTRVVQVNLESASVYGSFHCKEGFPVQFEDFSILSVGKVDPRRSYHCASQIWPIGYKSSWHDKITGSLFVCDISDGGDCGPVFKVQRYPCSTQLIPTGSTVLLRPCVGIDNNKTDSNIDINNFEDINVQMIFSNQCPPHLDFNVLTGIANTVEEVANFQSMDDLQINSNFIRQHLGKHAPNNRRLGDNIGEFLVEGRSSSSAWRMVSEKLVHSCREVYKETGVCNFCCRHACEWWSPCMVYETKEDTESTDSLAKFCHVSGPLYIPHHVENNDELTASCEALGKWLGQDRFGLDIDFVQEMIEQLPGVLSCSDYILMNKRSDKSKLQTVENGFLVARRKDDVQSEKETCSTLNGGKNHKKPLPKGLCPPGKQLSSKLPSVLVGDVLQSWELLWRFSEVLGLKEPLSFEDLEEELIGCYSSSPRSTSASTISGKSQLPLIVAEMESLVEGATVREALETHSSCTGETLSKAHFSLLKVLLAELQSKLAGFVDPTLENGESRSRKRRKKDGDHLIFARKSMLESLPINELTWPELARRYLLTVSSMEGNLDSLEIVSHESCKVFHCLQGDSGALYGSLQGVAVMEADALLLAEATKQIFGTSKNINDCLNMDSSGSVATSFSKEVKVDDGEVPKWAKVLEPVRKLPTNVGARIRRCIYDALALNPPEWATKILKHSISKEVYKGNASGPTKKAVLSVLADVCGANLQQKPNRKRKGKCITSLSEVIMKQCRRVLRQAAAADEEKVFCNLLGRTLLNTSDNDDEGLLGFPTMVSRPLDFRTIDLRLAFGAYGGSHEAFLEDVREVWNHILTAYADQSDLVHLAETLSQNFESLYEKEVLTLVQKLTGYAAAESLSSEAKKEIEDILELASEIPKAPWEEGVCKVCGVDKDDDNVLLCDKCDSGHHTYCLNPPLARVPEGNWYCPSCITQVTSLSQGPQFISQSQKRRHQGEFTHGVREALTHLGTTMEVKDYWECSIEERIFLLKFLGDEMLNTANIREHLDQCASVSADLLQKLRSLSTEWRRLKSTEEVLNEKAAKANIAVPSGGGKLGTEGIAAMLPNYEKLMGQPLNRSTLCSNPSIDLLYLEDGPQVHSTNELTKPKHWLYPKEILKQHSTSSGSQVMKFPDSEFQVNQPDANELQASNLEAIFIKNRISILQDSIACLDLQLQKVSLRKEFLGRDSAGRMYWVFCRPGSSPWVVVDGTTAVQQKAIVKGDSELLTGNLSLESSILGAENLLKFKGPNAFTCASDLTIGTPISCQWFSYQSDAEVEELIKWLRDSDPIQRELIESLMQQLKYREYDHSDRTGSNVEEMYQPTTMAVNVEKTVKSNALRTRASVALEKKYGPCMEMDVTHVSAKLSQNAEVKYDEEMCRCECLELVLPSRHHCHFCHWSFSTRCELEEHSDGKCSSIARSSRNSKVSDDVLKEKTMLEIEQRDCFGKIRQCKRGTVGHEIEFGLVGFSKDFSPPYNLEEISAKFVTRSSNKELVKEIGFLGSNGIPSFVPCASTYLNDPALKLVPPWKNEVSQDAKSMSVENQSQLAVHGNVITSKRYLNNSIYSIKRCAVGNIYNELEEIRRSNLMNDQRDKFSLRFSCSKRRNISSEIHASSLRHLVGKGAQILRRLKINLLDMDAALPEEALKSSKAYLEKRCTWRAFVKSAKSIFEMVQATIVFENMIKTDYLRNEWWYWSSLSAAAKIATISSLALRIYTLDAAIVYEKQLPFSSKETAEVRSISENKSSPCTGQASNQKPSSKPVLRTPNVDPVDNGKPQSRSGKKRKDSGG